MDEVIYRDVEFTMVVVGNDPYGLERYRTKTGGRGSPPLQNKRNIENMTGEHGGFRAAQRQVDKGKRSGQTISVNQRNLPYKFPACYGIKKSPEEERKNSFAHAR